MRLFWAVIGISNKRVAKICHIPADSCLFVSASIPAGCVDVTDVMRGIAW
jgi:hypothetical protein